MAYPRTAAFDAAVSGSHTAVVKADIYTVGLAQLVAPDLRVIGGSVTVDRTAAVRRQATVDVVDDDRHLVAAFTGSTRVDPGPLEMVVYRGVQYPNGFQEIIPQGVFSVSTANLTDFAGPTLNLTGYDRSRRVSRARFVDTYYIGTGTTYVNAATGIVDSRLPFAVPVTKSIETAAATATGGPTSYAESDDPWQRAQELVAAAGCEMFFDVDGGLRVRDEPDPMADTPTFEFADSITSVMLSVEHQLSDDPGFNGVVYTGASSAASGAVPRAVIWDTDPTSPTYYLGPYGMVPEFVNDPLVTTSAQCTVAGTAWLRRRLGLTDTIALSTVPHPALDASDIVRVTRGPDAIDTTVLVEALTMPLDVTTAATLHCRARRTSP